MKNQIWKFAVFTKVGILKGELEGLIKEGETEKQTLQDASKVIRDYLANNKISDIEACVVSVGTLHIDAPGATLIDLNVEEHFKH